MTFKGSLTETSFTKFSKLFKEDSPEKIVEIFRELFKYKDNIELIKVSMGGNASELGIVKYSSKGVLIHELFHLLQFKNAPQEAFTKYIKVNPNNIEEFVNYYLQPLEFNNQAISLASKLIDNNIKYSEIHKLKVPNNIDTEYNRLCFTMYHLYNYKSKRSNKLLELIKKYMAYIEYINKYSIKNINEKNNKILFEFTDFI